MIPLTPYDRASLRAQARPGHHRAVENVARSARKFDDKSKDMTRTSTFPQRMGREAGSSGSKRGLR